jgi:hypothetical protein
MNSQSTLPCGSLPTTPKNARSVDEKPKKSWFATLFNYKPTQGIFENGKRRMVYDIASFLMGHGVEVSEKMSEGVVIGCKCRASEGPLSVGFVVQVGDEEIRMYQTSGSGLLFKRVQVLVQEYVR